MTATLVLTVLPLVAAVTLAPASGARPSVALVWLLFVGSSTHIGATAWFYTLPEVRAHMRAHPTRYVWVPVGLVLAASLTAAAVPVRAMTWLLLGFFAWQFFHFQKQNLGVAALAAKANGAGRLSTLERRALTGAGVGGIAALLGHPDLLQLHLPRALAVLFPLGEAIFAVAVVGGLVALLRRRRTERAPAFVAVYLCSLLFFLPVFLFRSPYAAVAGLTIAHGLQYLLLVGLLSGAPTGRAPGRVGILMFVNLALVLGLALNQASHLHGSGVAGRCVYGAYLGVLMVHFVVDAGLWRLRDEFPRTFLTERLPYLLVP